jgi:molybdopterin-containing oxidoreductase family molybdopterin binding subunit
MDLVVVFDIFMSWTAQYADIVLPETTVFEQSDIQVSRHHIVRMQKAIEPLYEARPAFEIWSDLAQRVGLGHYFNQTREEIISILLDSKHPSLAGITLDKLESEVVIRANVPTTPRISFEDRRFSTPTGKVEFYTESLVKFGEELPSHKEPLESPRAPVLAKRYPLSLFTVKRKTRTQTITACDWILELEPEPSLDINPIDATRRRISDGQVVEVFNDRGKAKLKARLTEVVSPGTVNIDHGWLAEQFIDGHYAELFLRIDDPQQINPALDIEPIVSDSRAAGHTLHYDCLVEVRSAQE